MRNLQHDCPYLDELENREIRPEADLGYNPQDLSSPITCNGSHASNIPLTSQTFLSAGSQAYTHMNLRWPCQAQALQPLWSHHHFITWKTFGPASKISIVLLLESPKSLCKLRVLYELWTSAKLTTKTELHVSNLWLQRVNTPFPKGGMGG